MTTLIVAPANCGKFAFYGVRRLAFKKAGQKVRSNISLLEAGFAFRPSTWERLFKGTDYTTAKTSDGRYRWGRC